MMEPMTMMALAQMIMGAGGGKQLGGMAPAFQAGQMGMQEGGILDAIKRLKDQPGASTSIYGASPLLQALGSGYEEAQPAAAPAELVAKQDYSIYDNLPPGVQPTVGPPSPEDDPLNKDKPGFLGKFFNNLDSTFSSPSKQLGLGLLGQVNPYLGWGGLLGAGLWGDKLK